MPVIDVGETIQLSARCSEKQPLHRENTGLQLWKCDTVTLFSLTICHFCVSVLSTAIPAGDGKYVTGLE